jgi:hypothetical protein
MTSVYYEKIWKGSMEKECAMETPSELAVPFSKI